MLEAVRSNSIPFKSHAFFTNKPVGSGDHSKLVDFSFSQIQNKAIIQKNFHLAAKSIGCTENELCFLQQEHSSKVLIIKSRLDRPVATADGMVTNSAGLGLAILTADCAPVLFFDPIAKVIGASHAGWRGALSGILENTIDAMIKLGSKKDNILAVVGPCISKENYEVGHDLITQFLAHNIGNSKYFFPKNSKKYLFDLSGFIIDKLSRYGVSKVSTLNICTYDEKNNFHSYRRAMHNNDNRSCRNMSLIKL